MNSGQIDRAYTLLHINETPDSLESCVCLRIRIDEYNAEHSISATRFEDIVLSRELLAKIGRLKDALTEFEYAEICHCRDITNALREATRLLAYGRNTAEQLKRKLVLRGYSKSCASEAIGRLKLCGYIRENDDAIRTAEQMLKGRLIGKRKILSELKLKGYCDEAIAAAGEMLEGEDTAKYCLKCLSVNYDSIPEELAERQRLFAFMLRRGYSSGEIKQAIKTFMAERD